MSLVVIDYMSEKQYQRDIFDEIEKLSEDIKPTKYFTQDDTQPETIKETVNTPVVERQRRGVYQRGKRPDHKVFCDFILGPWEED
jgi:hypothetical protein